MTVTMLDKPLGDLRQEISGLHQGKVPHDYDINKLGTIISVSRDSLRETETFQKRLLQQLQQFESSLADINQILRANNKQKIELEQQQQYQESSNDIEIRSKLMALNAEALECRAVSVQLQQEAKLVLARAAEMERRANEELAQQALEIKLKQQEIEKQRAAELERRIRLEEERRRLQEQQLQQQREQERLLALKKSANAEEDYSNWKERDFMDDEHYPQCIFRLAPNALSTPLDVTFLKVSETENLLDKQEELISTPLEVKFDAKDTKQAILIAIPYILKRSTHRENIIKIRQSNGIWMYIDTKESIFDSHKDKRFAEGKLFQSAACAVVSRLKRDTITINKKVSGRFSSNSDPRLTLEWPLNVSERDFQMNLRILPIESSTFTQFSKSFSSECQGLLAVGPIVEFQLDDITLLKPIQFTLPMLVQTKKQTVSIKPPVLETQSSEQITAGQPSQQELILQQQQSIFQSVLGEDLSNERLVLLYSNSIDNVWQIDTNVRLKDSKTHDIITTKMQTLYQRMIVARYDRQLTSAKQLQKMISLLDQSLNERLVSLVLRRRVSNPNEVCFVCCSHQRFDAVDHELEQENYADDHSQSKELVLKEGQLLELRFRGNVRPTEHKEQSLAFAFNTYFPYYYQTDVHVIDKYSQHLSPVFYGFAQIFSKEKISRTVTTKDSDKKKQQSEVTKQEYFETDVCLAELVVRLPKPCEEIRTATPKTLTTFVSEGILTPSLFREIAESLNGDEWRRLARRLTMTRIRIEAIAHDYKEDAPYYMLLTWFKRAPRSTDKVQILINSLTNINRWDIAQELENIRENTRQEQVSTSRDEQLRLLSVPFNRICQRDECLRLWKQIARAFNLTNDDIQHIEEKYSSKQERCLRSLEHWAVNNNRADIPTLARNIRSLGFKSLSREINNMA